MVVALLGLPLAWFLLVGRKKVLVQTLKARGLVWFHKHVW